MKAFAIIIEMRAVAGDGQYDELGAGIMTGVCSAHSRHYSCSCHSVIPSVPCSLLVHISVPSRPLLCSHLVRCLVMGSFAFEPLDDDNTIKDIIEEERDIEEVISDAKEAFDVTFAIN